MPPQPTLRTTEVFASVQGEGLRLGEPTIFIRLTGCNLACEFCDTKYARRGGTIQAVEALVKKVDLIRKRFPAEWICLTGGEPHLQDVTSLVRALKSRGLKVQVETNGTVRRPLVADWYTVSPKPPAYKVAPAFRAKAREVKLVVTEELTLAVLRTVRRSFPVRTPILLQPRSNLRWSSRRAWELLRLSMAEGLKNIRLFIQAHKVLELP
jgi:7-carboxy-7-deazaguanine synthase